MTDSRQGRARAEISFSVNGEPKTVHAYPMERLLDVLRQQLQLSGTKEGCGEGECGSCAVLMDGILVNRFGKAFPAISAAAPDTVRLLTLWRKPRAAGQRHEIESL
jgi:carbon-monoxide dehydrogenase small subunit